MRRRTQYTLLAVLVVLAALAAVLYLRWKAPPEVARLLPESDAILFVNLKPVRAATHFDQTSVAHAAAYQQFIDATGIVPERDLDSAAFALHRMSDPRGPNGPVAYSEVFAGHFDAAKLATYLESTAQGKEQYAGRTIYAIPSEGRTLRVAVLGYDMVAASNMPTPEQIHSMLDRARAAASPFWGSSLLGERYRDVPAFAMAWGIGRLGLPFGVGGQVSVLGMKLPLPADATFVASVRFEGALHLRVEEIAGSEVEAQRSAEEMSSLLGLFKALQMAQQPVARTPEDVVERDLVDSLVVEKDKERAVVTASVAAGDLLKLGH